MKLIIEEIEQHETTIVENTSTGKKDYFIEGIFFQADKKNKNSRLYPKDIMKNAILKYQTEKIDKNGALGELDHPDSPMVNLDRASHRIISLNWDGNNVYGKALLFDTPMGTIAKRLIDGGTRLGVSSRGLGSITKNHEGTNIIGQDYSIAAVDIVHDPSAHDAFVDGIMEGVEWIMENNIIKPIIMEKYKDMISTNGVLSKPRRDNIQKRVYKDFLQKLYRVK